MSTPITASVAIACGGTGGHLFPGLAVAGSLLRHGCRVTLLISPKEVDQQAVKAVAGMEVITLPAVALSRGRTIAFLRGFIRSYRTARREFRVCRPGAVIAMGGFTAAPAVLAGARLGALTFIHESNAVPGRANRRLARMVNRVFLGFPQAAPRLRNRNLSITGTPVRPQFQPRDPLVCRVSLGLQADRPTLLVMGGSQGATGVNEAVVNALPALRQRFPELQWLHLTGPHHAGEIKRKYSDLGVRAVVHEFFPDMELALGAATIAVSRAGASSLAEIAAMRLASLLIPYPAAADDHQFYNARALVDTGAARMLLQKDAGPEVLGRAIGDLLEDHSGRDKMKAALAPWHHPQAAEQIAETVLNDIVKHANDCVATRARARDGRGIKPVPPPAEQQHISIA